MNTTATLDKPISDNAPDTIVNDIDITLIDPDPLNQSRPIDKAFQESITNDGVLMPIMVCPRNDGRFDLVAGERRWRASQSAGHSTIPAVIKDLSPQQRLIVQTVENLLRADLSITQQAVQCGRVLDVGMTRKELAARIGQKPAWIKARLNILSAPVALWPAIDSHTITLEQLGNLTAYFDNSAVLDALVEAVTSQHPPRDPEWFCGQLATKLAAQAEHERVLTELDSKGVRIVEWKGEHHSAKEAGYVSLESLGLTGREATKHAKEPCHAATVATAWNGKIRTMLVCTEPKRHTTKGTSAVKTPSGTSRPAADEERLAKQRRLRECTAQRDEAAVALFEALNQKDTIALLANYICTTVSNDNARLVAIQLGLKTEEMTGYQQWGKIIGDHAALSQRNLVTVARLVAYQHGVNGYSREFRQHVASTMTGRGWTPLHADDPLAATNNTDVDDETRERENDVDNGDLDEDEAFEDGEE
jgi:ParB family transcriptional regulator, chromosome partitioning protein